MLRAILLGAAAAGMLSLTACQSYGQYASSLPQYEAHDPSRCYSNVSFGSLTPSDPHVSSTTLTQSNGKACRPANDDTMAKMRDSLGAGGPGL